METLDKPAERPTAALPTRVTVVDFDMPFGSMIVFMLKWALASIPAFIILTIITAMTFGLLAVLVLGTAATAALLPRAASADTGASDDHSVPALVVTVGRTATGWRLSNDTSVARQNCSFSIAGHSVDIAALPSNSPREFAPSEFSGGGLPSGVAVNQSDLTVSCKGPEAQKARVYLLQ